MSLMGILQGICYLQYNCNAIIKNGIKVSSVRELSLLEQIKRDAELEALNELEKGSAHTFL